MKNFLVNISIPVISSFVDALATNAAALYAKSTGLFIKIGSGAEQKVLTTRSKVNELYDVSTTIPSVNQALVWNGSSYVPKTLREATPWSYRGVSASSTQMINENTMININNAVDMGISNPSDLPSGTMLLVRNGQGNPVNIIGFGDPIPIPNWGGVLLFVYSNNMKIWMKI